MHNIYSNVRKFFIALSSTLLMSCDSFFFSPLEVLSVEMNKNITITFNKDISYDSLNKNFNLYSEESTVKGIIRAEGNIVYFFPEENFTPENNYTLKLCKALESRDGFSMLSDYVKEFELKKSSSSPFVQNIDPSNFENVTEELSYIFLEFSKSIDEKSFYEAFSISPSCNFRVFFDEQKKQVKVCFDEPLAINKRYTCKLSTELKDSDGNYLKKEFSSYFDYLIDNTLPVFEVLGVDEDESIFYLERNKNNILSTKSYLKILFSKKISTSSFSSLCSVTPSLSFTFTNDEKENLYSIIEFSDEVNWGKSYEFRIAQGVLDESENYTKEEYVYILDFSREEERPPSFLYGEIICDDILLYSFTTEENYDVLVLDPIVFVPNETFYATVKLYFDLSEKASCINYLSALKNISFSVTQSCMNIYFISLDIKNGEISCLLEVKNTESKGLLKLSIDASLSDNLGNLIDEAMEFTFTKI